MALTQPSLIPAPWASSGQYAEIPETNSTAGRASWDAGFPPETALPLSSGGIPPHYLDFQGVLNILSKHAIFAQSGGTYTWSSSLDYPAGCFVLGSNGIVYQALQASGPGYSGVGAKNPATAANSAYWAQAATADLQTIISSGGKLTVNLANATNAQIKAITTYLVANAGGLSVDATTGRLSVDFQDLTVDQITPLCDPNGGIIVNNNEDDPGYGKLKIDFENMPEDKFKALLAQLHVPVWIGDKGITRFFYVDGTNGNDANDGKTAATAWKSLNFATTTVAKNYNISSYNVIIYVKGGTYTEMVNLPSVPRTTGAVYIRPLSSEDVVNLNYSTPTGNGCFSHAGGEWIIEDMNINLTIAEQTSSGTAFPYIVFSSDMTGSVTLRNCNLSFTDSTVSGSGARYARLLWSNGGMILLQNTKTVTSDGTTTTSSTTTTWSGTKANADGVIWMFLENNGVISARRAGNGVTGNPTITVSGSYTYFCNPTYRGMYRTTDVGNNLVFASATGSDAPSGQRYRAVSGGVIITTDNYATYFPGDTEGYVSTSQGSWIASV